MACFGSNPRKTTVLVVDDSPEIRRYLRALLELDSYEVEVASSGNEALERLRYTRIPDVVLLDVQMPGIDGLETLRRLLDLRPQPKVIMCSGLNDPEKIGQALSLGARAYLLKPIRHLYLTAAVERCLHEIPRNAQMEQREGQLFVLPAIRPEKSPLSRDFKS